MMRSVRAVGRIEATALGSQAGRHPRLGSELPPLHARCCTGVPCGRERCYLWPGTQKCLGPDSQKEGAKPCLLHGRGEALFPPQSWGRLQPGWRGGEFARPPSLSSSRRCPACLLCTRLVPVVRAVCSQMATS